MRPVQCSALHCMGWGVIVYNCSHSIRCSHRSVIHQLDQQAAAAAAAAIIVILLRPHSSMHDGVWLDPCGFTVSCQTCTLAGSTGPLGPVLPGACAIEKKRRKKREAVSSPAGLRAAPLLAREPGAQVVKGRRGERHWARLGLCSEDKEGKKLCTLPARSTLVPAKNCICQFAAI